jgi:NDP-hexose C3-ketoreductase / dTDP-4-oxo-2-deoxy-alpha-D-pentos-2-ene 2,3-reductase
MSMPYARLGRSRLDVSRLCLGAMNFGRVASAEDSFRILDRALEAGINYVDTSNSYSVPGEPGISERILGEWFAKGGGRREKTVLATKVFEDTDPWPNSGGLSALNIRRACDASLKRLQTDYLDVYQMHHVDRGAQWEEVWEAFEVLRTQGKIVYAGSSNFAGWHLAVAQGAARDRHFLGLISEQSVYSLAQRTIELEVLPAAEHLGIGVVAWSPLAGGLLSGASALGGRRSGADFEQRLQRHAEQLGRTRAIADRLGATVPQVAIAWLLSRPAVVAPIVGPRTLEQLDDLLPAAHLNLSQEDAAELDRIWPGPGGVAPEAYAW